MHMISQNIDGAATEVDGGASTPLGPSVAMPLLPTHSPNKIIYKQNIFLYDKNVIYYRMIERSLS